MAIVGISACDSGAAYVEWQQKVAAPVSGSVFADDVRKGVEADTRLSQMQKTLLESCLRAPPNVSGQVDVQL
jgi:hypothetical protein